MGRLNEKSIWFLSLIFFVLLTFLCFSILSDGHVWGDDFAIYIEQGIAMVNGDFSTFVERSSFTVNNSPDDTMPIFTSYGFPLILGVLYKVFGLNFLALKVVVTLFYLASAFLFLKLITPLFTYSLSRLFLFVFVFFNYKLVLYNNYILSEYIFLSFVTASFLLLSKYSPKRIVFSSVLCFFAFFTREIGFTLFIGIFASLLVARRSLYDIVAFVLPFVILLVLYQLSKPNVKDIHSALLKFDWLRVVNNLNLYAKVSFSFFSHKFYNASLGAFLLIPFFFGVFTKVKKLAPILFFLAAYFGVLLIWPFAEERYLYPVIPFLFLPVFIGFEALFVKLKFHNRLIFIPTLGIYLALLLFYNGKNILYLSKNQVNEVYSQENKLLYHFINDNIKTDEAIVFFKPKAIRLFIKANTCNLPQKSFEQSEINYLLWYKPNGEIGSREELEIIFESKRFLLFSKVN
jgi:hypothetical protein